MEELILYCRDQGISFDNPYIELAERYIERGLPKNILILCLEERRFWVRCIYLLFPHLDITGYDFEEIKQMFGIRYRNIYPARTVFHFLEHLKCRQKRDQLTELIRNTNYTEFTIKSQYLSYLFAFENDHKVLEKILDSIDLNQMIEIISEENLEDCLEHFDKHAILRLVEKLNKAHVMKTCVKRGDPETIEKTFSICGWRVDVEFFTEDILEYISVFGFKALLPYIDGDLIDLFQDYANIGFLEYLISDGLVDITVDSFEDIVKSLSPWPLSVVAKHDKEFIYHKYYDEALKKGGNKECDSHDFGHLCSILHENDYFDG